MIWYGTSVVSWYFYGMVLLYYSVLLSVLWYGRYDMIWYGTPVDDVTFEAASERRGADGIDARA
jgi:hypothetical protein